MARETKCHRRWDWLERVVFRWFVEELAKLDVVLNEEKIRVVDLTGGESFSFLGFDFRRAKNLRGKWGVRITPSMKARTALLRKLKEFFRRFQS